MRALGTFNPLAGARIPLRAAIRDCIFRAPSYTIEREVIHTRQTFSSPLRDELVRRYLAGRRA